MRFALSLIAALALSGCSKDEGSKAGGPAPASGKPTKPADPVAPGSLVGKPAPDFTLKDLTGAEVSLASFRGKPVVLEWFNPQCPYVNKSHDQGSLVGTAKKQLDAGAAWLAINSGGPGKQGHDPAANEAAVQRWALAHPVLRDETGATGKAYGATNTPHMFVIDASGTVVYAGAIDNSPDAVGESPEGGTLINYVDAALADLAAGRPVATPQTKAYGCSVKYSS
jgi:hypothetical protein